MNSAVGEVLDTATVFVSRTDSHHNRVVAGEPKV